MNSRQFFPVYYTGVKLFNQLVNRKKKKYAFTMYMEEFYIVFPEGDTQEIQRRIRINTLVDVNGNPLSLPLPTNRMVVFRVARVQQKESNGLSETYHYLELVSARELLEFCE